MNHPAEDTYDKIITGECTYEEFANHIQHIAVCEACQERHYERLQKMFKIAKDLHDKSAKLAKSVVDSIKESVVRASHSETVEETIRKLKKSIERRGPDAPVTFASLGADFLDLQEYHEHLAECEECRGHFYKLKQTVELQLINDPENWVLKKLVGLLKEVADKVEAKEKKKEEEAEASV